MPWLAVFCSNKIFIHQFLLLLGSRPFFEIQGRGGGGGHNSPEFLVGAGDSVLHQTLNLFQTKICNIPAPFFPSDLVSKIHSCFFKIHSHFQTFRPRRWLKSIPQYLRLKRLKNQNAAHRLYWGVSAPLGLRGISPSSSVSLPPQNQHFQIPIRAIQIGTQTPLTASLSSYRLGSFELRR